tara:strand:+ start:536 stop:775 length:240 start_codon:yes stop_codon:yes gene_type:complete
MSIQNLHLIWHTHNFSNNKQVFIFEGKETCSENPLHTEDGDNPEDMITFQYRVDHADSENEAWDMMSTGSWDTQERCYE